MNSPIFILKRQWYRLLERRNQKRQTFYLAASNPSQNGMGQHYTHPKHPVVQRAIQLAKATQVQDVLELATGSGIVSQSLMSRRAALHPNLSIRATDINEIGLANLKKRAIKKQWPVQTQPFDVTGTLPLNWRGAFDLVIAKDLLPFLNPQQVAQCLNNIADALKPGGWFLLTVPSTRSSLFQKSKPVSESNAFYRALSAGDQAHIQTTVPAFNFESVDSLSGKLKPLGLELSEVTHYGREPGWLMALGQKQSPKKS